MFLAYFLFFYNQVHASTKEPGSKVYSVTFMNKWIQSVLSFVLMKVEPFEVG